MDQSAARRVVDGCLVALMAEFGLPHWRVRVEYAPLDDGIPADVMVLTPYERATIRLDPAQHADAVELLSSLEHELLHLVQAPIDTFAEAALHFVPPGPAREALISVWHDANEASLRNLERLVHCQRTLKEKAMGPQKGKKGGMNGYVAPGPKPGKPAPKPPATKGKPQKKGQ